MIGINEVKIIGAVNNAEHQNRGGLDVFTATLQGRIQIGDELEERLIPFYQRVELLGNKAKNCELKDGDVAFAFGKLVCDRWETPSGDHLSRYFVKLNRLEPLVYSSLKEEGKSPTDRQNYFYTGQNEILVAGNLTADAELRYTTGGKAVCSFTVAINESFKNGDDWETRTEFFRVSSWGSIAEESALLTKGSAVIVKGSINNQSWDSDNGKRYSTEISATSVIPSLIKQTSE